MALDTNLLAYYKLSNGAYTTDSVASYTLTAGSSTQQSGGFSGYCGSGDNLTYAGNYGISGTADISVSWWVKFTSDINATGKGMMFFGSTLTTDRLFALDYEYNGGTRRLNIFNSSASISQSYNTTLGTTWHHVAIVRASTAITVYLDGVAVMSGVTQGSTTGASSTLAFGTGKNFGSDTTEYYDEIAVWSRAITADEVLQIHNSGRGNFYPFTATPSLYGAVAYWKLDESSGNAVDSISGNTLTNANVTYSSTNARINNGAVFDSTTDSLSTAVYTPFNVERTDTFSISKWIYITDLTNGSYIIDREDSGTLRGLVWFVQSNGKLRIQFGNNNDGTNCIYVDSTSAEISTNTLYHVMVTYDGSSLASGVNMYVNNTAISMTTVFNNLSATTQNTQSLYVGNRIAGGNNFSGTLDELCFARRVFNSTERSSLYNGGLGNQYPFANAYNLVCAVGSFTLTGISAGLLYGRKLIANVGSFALTGISVTFSKGYGMVASVGVFILTGIAVTFRLKRWNKASKSNTTSWSNRSKSNTSSWTNQTK